MYYIRIPSISLLKNCWIFFLEYSSKNQVKWDVFHPWLIQIGFWCNKNYFMYKLLHPIFQKEQKYNFRFDASKTGAVICINQKIYLSHSFSAEIDMNLSSQIKFVALENHIYVSVNYLGSFKMKNVCSMFHVIYKKNIRYLLSLFIFTPGS